VLQRSQHATLKDVPEAERQALLAGASSSAAPSSTPRAEVHQ
jgi:hypothetical protein